MVQIGKIYENMNSNFDFAILVKNQNLSKFRQIVTFSRAGCNKQKKCKK